MRLSPTMEQREIVSTRSIVLLSQGGLECGDAIFGFTRKTPADDQVADC